MEVRQEMQSIVFLRRTLIIISAHWHISTLAHYHIGKLSRHIATILGLYLFPGHSRRDYWKYRKWAWYVRPYAYRRWKKHHISSTSIGTARCMYSHHSTDSPDERSSCQLACPRHQGCSYPYRPYPRWNNHRTWKLYFRRLQVPLYFTWKIIVRPFSC